MSLSGRLASAGPVLRDFAFDRNEADDVRRELQTRVKDARDTERQGESDGIVRLHRGPLWTNRAMMDAAPRLTPIDGPRREEPEPAAVRPQSLPGARLTVYWTMVNVPWRMVTIPSCCVGSWRESACRGRGS